MRATTTVSGVAVRTPYWVLTGGLAVVFLFPLVWSFRGKDSSTTVAFPLVWHFRRGDGSTTVVPPFVHVSRDSSRFRALVPFYWEGRDGAARTAWSRSTLACSSLAVMPRPARNACLPARSRGGSYASSTVACRTTSTVCSAAAPRDWRSGAGSACSW